jgi:hypothetical protein
VQGLEAQVIRAAKLERRFHTGTHVGWSVVHSRQVIVHGL